VLVTRLTSFIALTRLHNVCKVEPLVSPWRPVLGSLWHLANVHGTVAQSSVRRSFDKHRWLSMPSARRLRCPNDLLGRCWCHILGIGCHYVSHPLSSLRSSLTVSVRLNARKEALDFLVAWSRALRLAWALSLRGCAKVAAGLVLRRSTVWEVLR